MKEDKKKVFMRTFGCQMNKLDSSIVTAAMQADGFTLTEKIGEADVVIINTCSVRQHAEERVLSHLGHIKHLKQTRPDLIVAVIGCMAQRLGGELLKHQAVDIVCGPAQIAEIPNLVNESLAKKNKLLAVSDKIREEPAAEQAQSLDDFESAYDRMDEHLPRQAYVRVMRGCNKFCTYCVVPYVRGKEQCRSPQSIIAQVKKLAAEGVRQITFLGQTVNSYTYTAGEKTYNLADLLEMANDVEGIKWIRFITSYPADFDESILHAMAKLPKVCPYLHIPAQSGSDRILKSMNRHYTAAEYLALLQKARQIVPDIAIAGDFIVGFSGETEEDFQATIDLVEKARYKNCFIFKYSPRPGTSAIKKLQDDTPEEIKKQRNTKLLEVQNRISEQFNKQFLGQTLEVLVEGQSKKPHLDNSDLSQLVGRTAADYIVVFNGSPTLAGEFVNVKIVKTSPLTLFGEMI